VTIPDNGLGGILAVRLGGCGNELILTVFRMDLPALFTPAPLGTGRAMVGAGDKGGPLCMDAADGALSPLLGLPGVLVGLAIPPVLFRLFGMGKAGRAPVGGSLDPRRRGNVVAILIQNEHSITHEHVIWEGAVLRLTPPWECRRKSMSGVECGVAVLNRRTKPRITD
jgi:hypothetical protein